MCAESDSASGDWALSITEPPDPVAIGAKVLSSALEGFDISAMYPNDVCQIEAKVGEAVAAAIWYANAIDRDRHIEGGLNLDPTNLATVALADYMRRHDFGSWAA